MKKNDQRRYKCRVLGRDCIEFYIKQKPTPIHLKKKSLKLISSKCSSFFINNIFVMFGGRVYQQTVGIDTSTNCVPFVADLFLYLYEADFIQ